MLGKGERAADTGMRKGLPPLQLAGHPGIAHDGFAMQFLKFRLVLIRVHLRNHALHEEKDAMLGLANPMERRRL